MAIEIKLPDLGENIASGDIVNVLVNEGDTVSKDQSILEVQADKAVVNIPAPSAGKISKIHVKQGDTVEVGKLVITLDGDGAAAPAAKKSDAPKSDAPKAEAKPAEKKSEENHAGPNNVAAKPVEKKSEEKKFEITPAKSGSADSGSPVPAGPAARRLAREFNVNLKSLNGTGPHGRITPDDVIAAVKRQQSSSGSGGGRVTAPPMNVADFEKFGPIKTEKLTRIRQAIA
ncbi:MAG TPA: biotin/lipoyl-containing protein, partial [Pirellulales bacterium]